MNKRDEELVNKYLDGDISSEELDELKTRITIDAELKQHISANNFIERNLLKMHKHELPADFTGKVMKEISVLNSNSAHNSDRKFFVTMGISFFVLMVVIFMGIILSGGTESNKLLINWDYLPEFSFTSLFDGFGKIFNVHNYKTLYFSVSLLALAIWGMLWNAFKNFKRDISLKVK